MERLIACGLALALVLGGAALLHDGDDASPSAPRALPWAPAVDEARDAPRDAPPEPRFDFAGFRSSDDEDDDDRDDDRDEDDDREKEKRKDRGKGKGRGKGGD